VNDITIIKETKSGTKALDVTTVLFEYRGAKYSLITIDTSHKRLKRYTRSLYNAQGYLDTDTHINEVDQRGYRHKGFHHCDPMHRKLYNMGYLDRLDFSMEE
jgi:hypothetical protein